MAGIFTKRIWRPCVCQPNDLKVKKELGGQTGGQAKILGGAWSTQAPPKNRHWAEQLSFVIRSVCFQL